MAEEKKEEQMANAGGENEGSSAVSAAPKKAPKPPKPSKLPPYKVLLHNDNVNDCAHVIRSIVQLTSLSAEEAEQRMWEAHSTGVALLLVTHKERAELYQEQFQSCSLTVTIEPA